MRLFTTSLLLATLATAGCYQLREAQAPADRVLRGGVVHTMDPALPEATAIALRGDTILAVGDDAAMTALAGPDTAIDELGGRTVVPGFQDSHTHPLTSGIELGECSLGELDTTKGYLRAIQARLKAYAAAHPKKAWIKGSGWELPWFPQANPHKSWLDAIVRDRPVLLWASDGHSAWANSKALQLAGISRKTKDPAHGRIERDRQGEPTGTLREDAADLVSDRIPAASATEREEGLKTGLALAGSLGITSFVEANAKPEQLATYAALDRRGALTARVLVNLSVDPDQGPEQVARFEALRAKYTTSRVRPIAAKLFLDGVIEAKTAALVSPYVGGVNPPVSIAPARLNALVTALDRAGFQAHMHAIGDGAVRAGLDAVAAARAANGPRDARHTIAHLELIAPEDLGRFKALGVIASFQPFWAVKDSYIRDLTEPYVGPERSKRLYPIGDLWRTGATVAFGSDWNVTTLDPLQGMAVAVGRRDPAEGPGPAWLPDQCVTAADALAGYTRNAAYQAFQEARTGTLTPGKAADLVVLAKDPLALPARRIPEAKVLLTLLDGAAVYTAPGFKLATHP